MTDEEQTQANDEQPRIDPAEFVAFVTQSQNIVEGLPDTGPNSPGMIAQAAIEDYRMDRESMGDWLTQMKKGIELAKLVKEDKSYPFKGAANIKFPLVTSAALQFNARAYPAIVPADQIVKVKTFGADPGGAKAARAERVAAHMSWQLGSNIEEWEEDTDRLLVQLPIVGTMIRKAWFDPVKGRARCRLVEPGKFIVNAKVKSMSDAPRLTEELPLYPTEILDRIRSGLFIEFEWSKDTEDDQKAEEFIEQHRLIDLDEDGYPEPYIATVHVETQKLVRLVADFEQTDVQFETAMQSVEVMVPTPEGPVPVMQPQEVATGIKHIRRGTYFTAYHFLPSLDGGFWGTGLGLLLGDISSSINSIINMLLDAGHYASLGGGFIGSEFRIKGGNQRMKPGEWRLTNNKGADIRQSLVPLTYPGPDATLFSLLGLLIEAGREVASVKDILTGDTGTKNMTATTTLALIEQGMMVFTAAYKRIFRSLKSEFRILAKINQETVSPQEYNEFHDEEAQYDPREEYNLGNMDIAPVADPRSVTKMQEAAKAELLMQMAAQGLVDQVEAGRRVLEATEIGDTEELAPKPNPVAEEMGMLNVQAAKAGLSQQMAEIELTLAKVAEAKTSAVKNMADADAAKAKIRLNAIETMLEAARDGLAQTLAGGLGSMAQPPSNGNAPGVLPVPGGAGAPFGNGSVLAGQGLAAGAENSFPAV